ncbi:MAG TPA: DUF2280 domain-containing protein [Pyrinomonadaceae bacterium]|jgi:hypothetical protein
MAEGKLDSTQQVFVVQQLAMFERPKAVQEQIKEVWSIEISLPAIIYYDGRNPDLPKKLKALFNSTRKKFLENASNIPIANKSYRLSKLQRMFESEESADARMQNKKAMRAILEQAAKESGDAYTNQQKHEHTGKDGKPLGPQTITVNVVQSASVIKDEPDDKHQ